MCTILYLEYVQCKMQPNFNDEGFYNVVRNKYFLECVVLVSCVMFGQYIHVLW